MKKSDPRTLAIDLTARSTCTVQVAAVLFDDHGIFAWGWNSAGDGFGQHAEIHAIERANPKRLRDSAIAVAGRRRNNIVPSMPCAACWKRLMRVGVASVAVECRNGRWLNLDVTEDNFRSWSEEVRL